MTPRPVSAEQRQASVKRMLEPTSVAIVGGSEAFPFLDRIAANAVTAGLRLMLVQPKRREMFGRPTIGSLLDADGPVDSILSLVGADQAVRVVEEAEQIGAGGVIVTAARFGESGPDGRDREDAIRLVAERSGLAICGPNCLGVFNVTKSVHLYVGAERHVRRGHVALLSQSGGLLTTVQLAAQERRIGFSQMISSGNEAATDLTDFLDYLIDDPGTAAVAMVIEEVRRPAAFLEAAARARDAGMYLTALKLGRSPGGQIASVSHTGALLADARDYDVALRQAGIDVAAGIEDMLGRLQLFSHLPPERWAPARRVAVLTASGGMAAMAADAFDEAGLVLPQDAQMTSELARELPGTLSANPLDITGLLYKEEAFTPLLDRYLQNPIYDTVMVINYLQDGMEAFARPLLGPLRQAAREGTPERLLAVAGAETAIATWAEDLLDDGVALGGGIRSAVASLSAMTRFCERHRRSPLRPVDPWPRPESIVRSGGTEMLSFGESMKLLGAFGIPTAPYVVWEEEPGELPAGDRFVVKLADVPHRTEIGAVRLGLVEEQVTGAFHDLRALARKSGLPTPVVVQPMLAFDHELFIGVQGTSTFGPLVAFGLGGTAVEAFGDVTTRLAALAIEDASEMLDEVGGSRTLDDFRGRPGVDREGLAQLLVAVGEMGVATSGWLESLDINPLLGNTEGFFAVDISVIMSRSE